MHSTVQPPTFFALNSTQPHSKFWPVRRPCGVTPKFEARSLSGIQDRASFCPDSSAFLPMTSKNPAWFRATKNWSTEATSAGNLRNPRTEPPTASNAGSKSATDDNHGPPGLLAVHALDAGRGNSRKGRLRNGGPGPIVRLSTDRLITGNFTPRKVLRCHGPTAITRRGLNPLGPTACERGRHSQHDVDCRHDRTGANPVHGPDHPTAGVNCARTTPHGQIRASLLRRRLLMVAPLPNPRRRTRPVFEHPCRAIANTGTSPSPSTALPLVAPARQAHRAPSTRHTVVPRGTTTPPSRRSRPRLTHAFPATLRARPSRSQHTSTSPRSPHSAHPPPQRAPFARKTTKVETGVIIVPRGPRGVSPEHPSRLAQTEGKSGPIH